MELIEPKISVVVPVYNVAEYLNNCVASITDSLWRNLEIILVDDGSTDDSSEICDQWAAKDSRIIVIHKTNGGLVSARIAGCKAATGDYIGYVDGDDFIEPGFYLSMAQAVQAYHPDLVMSGFCRFENGKVSSPELNGIPCGYYDKKALEAKVLPYILDSDPNGKTSVRNYVWCKLFRSELLKKKQSEIPLNVKIGEDSILVLKMLANAESAVVTDNSDYRYRRITDSMSSAYDPLYSKRIAELLKYVNDELRRSSCPRAEEQLASYTLNLFFIGSVNLVRRSLKMSLRSRYAAFCELARLPVISKACREKRDRNARKGRHIEKMYEAVGRKHLRLAFIQLLLFQSDVLLKKLRR